MWQATIWEPATSASGKSGTSGANASLALAAEQARLARLRRQVDDRWRTLALATERATPPSAAALDRLYDAYMRAVEAYVACQRALDRRAASREQRRAS